MRKFVFICIILLAVFFRFNNVNWDQNLHLHPDERFLTMVATSIKVPDNFFKYLDPMVSTFNPANVGYKFFVYGTLPLILGKLAAIFLSSDNYNQITLIGRSLSALADIFVIFFIYKIVGLWEKKYRFGPDLKLWACFFYSIAVLPIQLSHFFAVDTFLNLFLLASFYFASTNIFFSALFFGFAFSSKITAIFILPLNLLFIILRDKFDVRKIIARVFAYFVIFYFVLRIVSPYIFQTAKIYDFHLNPGFISNLETLKSLEKKDIWYPPAIQWISKTPVVFSFFNLATFGLGWPYFALVVVGMGTIISAFKRNKVKLSIKIQKYQKHQLELIGILAWIILFFIYQSTQFAQAMRYFLIIYPFLAIFAAIGFRSITGQKMKIAIYLLVLVWPFMFSTIYLFKNTRVEASEWIYQNIPDQSILLSEHWDDPLPFYGPWSLKYPKEFQVDSLPVFDPDTPEKWQNINSLLERGDYYILSSNRGWGSIPTVPNKYPLMSQFYNKLLANRLEYKKTKEFKPYYYRFFEFPNSWVDESFTVYDHPTVMIFKHGK